jgi:hypothetical protein
MGGSCNIPGGDNAHKMKSENLKGRDHLEDLGVDGRIILKQIFVVKMYVLLMQGQVVGLRIHSCCMYNH